MTQKKLSWMDKAPATLTECHSKRCKAAIVENRLCAEHNAYWMAHGFQPPMPDYAGKPPEIEDQLKPVIEAANKAINDISTMKVRSEEDVEVLQQVISEIQMRRREVRSSLNSQVKPLEECSARIKKAHELPDLRLGDAAKLAEHLIAEYKRNSMPPAAGRAKKKTG
jgi:peptidoglycan hydrolase CwlO-like protein